MIQIQILFSNLTSALHDPQVPDDDGGDGDSVGHNDSSSRLDSLGGSVTDNSSSYMTMDARSAPQLARELREHLAARLEAQKAAASNQV